MRVRLVTTDRDPFWLIGHPAKNERDEQSQAMEESIQVTRNMQDQAGAEWDAREFYDRKNQRLSLDATVRYEFASEIERMDFIGRIAALEEANQEHLWEGDVWLRIDKRGSSTGEFKEWLMPRSVVALAGTKLDGECSIRLSYRIASGGLSHETREGTSGLAVLILSSGGGPGFEITAEELQDFVDAQITGDTTRFYFSMEMRLPESPYAVGASAEFVPEGDAVEEYQFELPVASSIADFAAYLHSQLSGDGGSVTEEDGVLRFVGVSDAEPPVLNFWAMVHRYMDGVDEAEGNQISGEGVDLSFGIARLTVNDSSTEKLLTLITET